MAHSMHLLTYFQITFQFLLAYFLIHLVLHQKPLNLQTYFLGDAVATFKSY